ncbi:hypothetical protein DKP78_12080 [Enterococcus faecium]|nr:hypothetical protein DKP78_12080 [Enterococcus faecium]
MFLLFLNAISLGRFKVEYSLSILGQSLIPVLDAICYWGEDQLKKKTDY